MSRRRKDDEGPALFRTENVAGVTRFPVGGETMVGRTDPETSTEAAKNFTNSGSLGRDQRNVLNLVRLYPGKTVPELARIVMAVPMLMYAETAPVEMETVRQAIGRRMSELKRAGEIFARGAKDGCQMWWPKLEKP